MLGVATEQTIDTVILGMVLRFDWKRDQMDEPGGTFRAASCLWY